MEPTEAVQVLNPKMKSKKNKIMNNFSQFDCKYCSLLCMLIILLVVEFTLSPTPTLSLSNGQCFDKRDISLDSNGTYRIVLCKNYTESRRYHSLHFKLSGEVYNFNEIEAESLRYFLLWCPHQGRVCDNYITNRNGCYRAFKYKQITSCFGNRLELRYMNIGNSSLTQAQAKKLEQVVIYWY